MLWTKRMIVFYGRAKVWLAFQELCHFLDKECHVVDDHDETIDIELLQRADVIVPTPGIPQTHTIYRQFPDKIVSELDICECIMNEEWVQPMTIGITGTDGKSTVTWIIAQTLAQILPFDQYEVHITGNFDEPLSKTILNILQQIRKPDQQVWVQHVFVMECSSFMLYPTKKYHFDIGVRTNFAPDHLNRHPSLDEYFRAKQQLIALSDRAFVDSNVYSKLDSTSVPKSQIYPTEYDLTTTHFIGNHNARNCALAFSTVYAFCTQHHIAVTDNAIHQAIGTVLPLKHRMQPVTTIDGITRYDDGKSTSAQSLGAALEWFTSPCVVMVGGSDKGDNFNHLISLFKKHTCYGVCIWHTAEKFAGLFEAAGIPHTIVSSMQENVATAREKAQELWATSILFSPGCASLDMFRNYEDRAQQFLTEVDRIKRENTEK